MKKQASKNQVIVYQAKSGAIKVKKDARTDTIWATQADIAKIYEKDQSVVSRHVNNIFKEGEVSKKTNMQKMHIANSDKPVTLYSLDIILAVGYRTSSKRAIDFRKWATKTLRQHIAQGYTINKSRIAKNYQQFQEAVNNIKDLLPAAVSIDTASVLNLVNMFADTWLSLEAYDKDTLITKGATKKRVAVTAEKLSKNLSQLKNALIEKGEATDLFGTERQSGSIDGIVGSIMQSFGGKDVYASIEEKAAHLLYFMVKDHPFVDGNKRSGAYAFVWFLQQAKVLNTTRITPPALTALTILVAESDPKDKEKVIHLILTLLLGYSGPRHS